MLSLSTWMNTIVTTPAARECAPQYQQRAEEDPKDADHVKDVNLHVVRSATAVVTTAAVAAHHQPQAFCDPTLLHPKY